MCYWLISDKFYSLVERSPDDMGEITTKQIAQFLIPKILIAQAVSLLFVFMLSILVTHTIAGPVYRMERIARDIGQGNLRGHTRLRPRDELKELADAFNVMTEGLATRIRGLREEVEALDKRSDGKVDLAGLRSILGEFQLPEDVTATPGAGLGPDGDDDEDEDEGSPVGDEELEDEEIIEDSDTTEPTEDRSAPAEVASKPQGEGSGGKRHGKKRHGRR
jgi:HAMP domain-containing protein